MLAYDPAEAIAHLRAADPVLAAAIDRCPPFTLTPSGLPDLFPALLESIVYQQLAGKAAATIHGRVRALFPDATPTPEALLALPDEALRGAGLSGNKTLAARSLATCTLDGTLPATADLATLPDDEIIRRLTCVRGIGPWTVQMILLFDLGRPDVWPTTDYGVQKGFQRVYGLDEPPKPKALQAAGERFRPYRSVAAWYFWRVLDVGK